MVERFQRPTAWQTHSCALTQTQAGKSCCCWIKQNRPEPVRANSVPAVGATYFLVSLTDTHTLLSYNSTAPLYPNHIQAWRKAIAFHGRESEAGKKRGKRERLREVQREKSYCRSSPCVILHNFINHIIRQENDPRETNRFRLTYFNIFLAKPNLDQPVGLCQSLIF